MTAAELTEWTAYEQTYGPILVQDRIDIGLAQVNLILVKLLGKKSKHTIRDFLPAWWRGPINQRSDEAVVRGMEALMRQAQNADD